MEQCRHCLCDINHHDIFCPENAMDEWLKGYYSSENIHSHSHPSFKLGYEVAHTNMVHGNWALKWEDDSSLPSTEEIQYILNTLKFCRVTQKKILLKEEPSEDFMKTISNKWVLARNFKNI